MQDETENNQSADPQADQPVAEGEAAAQQADQPAAEGAAEAPPEEQPAEEQPAEEPAAEEQPPEEPAAAEAPVAEAAEPPEQLSPKQRRRLARSRAGDARPERSTEERAGERVEARRRKAAERSRWRARRKEKKGRDPAAAVSAQDVASAEPGKRKVRQGVVVSSKGDKTITVRIDAVRRHRVYGKVVRASGTLHAHDESNEAGEGDLVRVVESRPLSRTKRWRLVDVLEKAR
jgi:small subunit ribosomal protein S17